MFRVWAPRSSNTVLQSHPLPISPLLSLLQTPDSLSFSRCLPKVSAPNLLERRKGHTHKGREKVLNVMSFRIFQAVFKGFLGEFQGVFPYALSGYALWILLTLPAMRPESASFLGQITNRHVMQRLQETTNHIPHPQKTSNLNVVLSRRWRMNCQNVTEQQKHTPPPGFQLRCSTSVFWGWCANCGARCKTKMVQNGQDNHFGQHDLIQSQIFAFATLKWTPNFGSPTVLWPLLNKEVRPPLSLRFRETRTSSPCGTSKTLSLQEKRAKRPQDKLCSQAEKLGGAPSTVKHFWSKIRNKSGKTPETLSEQVLNFQVSYGWRSPNPGK